MSKGNGNPKHGDKGSNFNFERANLGSLKKILDAIAGAGIPSPTGLATEATMLSILSALDDSTQDAEIMLVRDTGDSDDVVQQITTWDDGVAVVTYKKVDGSTHSVVGPMEYIDLSAALTLIYGELAAGTVTHTSVVATTASSVPIGSLRGSVFNAGDAAGTWNGISLPAGMGMPWGEVGNRDTYAAITYDGTGTSLIIEYTI